VAQVREMNTQGIGATKIVKALKIHRASVYRVLEGGHLCWNRGGLGTESVQGFLARVSAQFPLTVYYSRNHFQPISL
jgi:hypothetical protein